MTITKQDNVVAYTVVDEDDTTYEYDFWVADKGSLEVWLGPTDEALELLDESEWSITGLKNEAGGTVTILTSLPLGSRLWLRRQTRLTQESILTDQTRYNGRIHGDVADKLTTLIQDLRRDGRHRPRTRYPDGTLDMIFPEPEPNRFIGFDALGNLGLLGSPAEIGLPSPVNNTYLFYNGSGQLVTSSGPELDRFDSRAALVAWRAGNTRTDGREIEAGGLRYRWKTGETTLPNLPDIEPVEPFWAEHWGCVGDVAFNDRPALDAALLWLEARGGGRLNFNPRTYAVNGNLAMRSGVALVGTPGITRLQRIGSEDKQVLYNPYRNTANGPLHDIFIYGIIFDNAKQEQIAAAASSAAGLGPVWGCRIERCYFQNANGYGLGFQSGQGQSDARRSEDVTIIDCVFQDNGTGGPGETYDGLDIKEVKNLVLLNCIGRRNGDKGINVRGDNLFLAGLECYENAVVGLEVNASVSNTTQQSAATVIGGTFRDNDGFGISCLSGTTGGVNRLDVIGVKAYNNTLDGLYVTSGNNNRLKVLGGNFFSNTRDGIRVQDATDIVNIIGADCSDNGGSGVFSNVSECVTLLGVYADGNDRYGFEESAGASGNRIGSGCVFLGNALGSHLAGTNNRTFTAIDFVDYAPGSGDVIASASTILLPRGGQVFTITGTTTINIINGRFRGRVVHLLLPSGITINHQGAGGGNIWLDGGANYTTPGAGKVLTLVYDGTNWREPR